MLSIKKVDKFIFLKGKISNKTILHVGCCGVVKKIETKGEINKYLHKFLCDNSKSEKGS